MSQLVGIHFLRAGADGASSACGCDAFLLLKSFWEVKRSEGLLGQYARLLVAQRALDVLPDRRSNEPASFRTSSLRFVAR